MSSETRARAAEDSTAWMDRDNESSALLAGTGMRIRPDQCLRLGRLQQRVMNDALHARTGRHIAVVLYAITAPSDDSGLLFAQLQEFAIAQHWRIDDVAIDPCTAALAPEDRRGYTKACKRITSGYAHGILTFDRDTVSPGNTEYENALHWLHQRLAFAAHLPSADAARQ